MGIGGDVNQQLHYKTTQQQWLKSSALELSPVILSFKPDSVQSYHRETRRSFLVCVCAAEAFPVMWYYIICYQWIWTSAVYDFSCCANGDREFSISGDKNYWYGKKYWKKEILYKVIMIERERIISNSYFFVINTLAVKETSRFMIYEMFYVIRSEFIFLMMLLIRVYL